MGEYRTLENSGDESEFTFDDHGILWHRGNAYVRLPEAAAALLKKADVEPVHLTMSQAEALFDSPVSTMVPSAAPRFTPSVAAPLPSAMTPASKLPAALGSGSQVPSASVVASAPAVQPSAPAPTAIASSSWDHIPPLPSSSVSTLALKEYIVEVVNQIPKNLEPVVQSKPKVTPEEERRQFIKRDKTSACAWEALLAGPIEAASSRGAVKSPLTTSAAAAYTAVVKQPAVVPDEVSENAPKLPPAAFAPYTFKAVVNKPAVVLEIQKDTPKPLLTIASGTQNTLISKLAVILDEAEKDTPKHLPTAVLGTPKAAMYKSAVNEAKKDTPKSIVDRMMAHSFEMFEPKLMGPPDLKINSPKPESKPELAPKPTQVYQEEQMLALRKDATISETKFQACHDFNEEFVSQPRPPSPSKKVLSKLLGDTMAPGPGLFKENRTAPVVAIAPRKSAAWGTVYSTLDLNAETFKGGLYGELKEASGNKAAGAGCGICKSSQHATKGKSYSHTEFLGGPELGS